MEQIFRGADEKSAKKKAKSKDAVRCRLYFDGSTRGNGTKHARSGAGAVLHLSTGEVRRTSKALGMGTTNNQAEYCGLLEGLRLASELGVRHVDAYGDSDLVIKQVEGTYATRNPKLAALRDRVRRTAAAFDSVVYRHIPRDQNAEADALARAASAAPAAVARHSGTDAAIKLG